MITFNIDNIVEYYNEHGQTEWDDADFPNVAPPFLNFMFKFIMPKYIKVQATDRMIHPFAGSQWMTVWNATETTVKGIQGWFLKAVVSSDIDLDFAIQLFCDKYGVLQPVLNLRGKQVSSMLSFDEYKKDMSVFERQGYIDACTTIMQPQLLALSFLHCKNVKTIEVNPNLSLPSRVRRHWEKKGRKPLDNYNIINIYPMNTPTNNPIHQETKDSTNNTPKALTICRGHFKDYRNGKGLFGKYHGIFWIESFVKDAKKNIDVDYKIKL